MSLEHPSVETLSVRTEQSENSGTVDALRGQVDDLDRSMKFIRILVAGAGFLIILELLGVAVDLFQDRNTYEQAVNLNLTTNGRVDELEHQLAAYRKEIVDKEIILECLRIRKYWEYPDCFNR